MTNCNDQISIYHILFCSERSYFKWTPLTTEKVKTDFKDWVWMLSGNTFQVTHSPFYLTVTMHYWFVYLIYDMEYESLKLLYLFYLLQTFFFATRHCIILWNVLYYHFEEKKWCMLTCCPGWQYFFFSREENFAQLPRQLWDGLQLHAAQNKNHEWTEETSKYN